MRKHPRHSILLERLASGVLLWLALTAVAAAQDTRHDPAATTPVLHHNALGLKPTIGIIIDDLGNLQERDTRAIELPGDVTCAFLPHTPFAAKLATLAHNNNKEVMVHLPMQSLDHNPLGPGGLTLHMTHDEFIRQLRDDIQAIPYAVGLNNHMGSLLTQHPGSMAWLMQEILEHQQFYFVDSYTTVTSVAHRIADEYWVPNLKRDVFLDNDRHPQLIAMEFDRLLYKARTQGIALAIGHPYPETLEVLERELPKLEEQGVQLLSVSKLLHHYSQRTKSWYASLSR